MTLFFFKKYARTHNLQVHNLREHKDPNGMKRLKLMSNILTKFPNNPAKIKGNMKQIDDSQNHLSTKMR